jgi:hypothetical protein
MAIKTVELFHRIGRRARGGDFTKLSMSEQQDIATAANAALERLYNALPTYFQVQTQGFVLPAPLAITGVGVTQYGKTVTGHSFTSAQFGQTVVLDGDPGWNQIIGTNDLLNPYMGDTGTVNGIVYGNAIHSDTYPLDRIIGNVQYANGTQSVLYQQNIAATNSGVNSWLLNQAVGFPQVCWSQTFGNSQGNSPLAVLRFAPAPAQAYAVNVQFSFWPKRLTLADYDDNAALVVPDQFIEPSLIPMAIGAFMDSPAWDTGRGDEAAVQLRADRAEQFAKMQPGQLGPVNNRVYTPLGF